MAGSAGAVDEKMLERMEQLIKQQQAQIEAQAKALEATVKADESAIQIARLNLGYTEIRAPIDGKTGALLVSVGNLVKANDTVSLVVITQDRPVKISFTLPQQALPKLQTRLGTGDLKVEVSIPGDTRPPAAGTVRRTAGGAPRPRMRHTGQPYAWPLAEVGIGRHGYGVARQCCAGGRHAA